MFKKAKIICIYLFICISLVTGCGVTELDSEPDTVNSEDIFVNPDDITDYGTKGAGQKSKLWPNRSVPYEIDSNLPNQQRILATINIYNQLGFNFHVRNYGEPNYIRFVRSTTGTGWSDYVGMKGGPQEIGVSDYAFTSVALHEIGHALGLSHEQQRIDRSRYIDIKWDNITEDCENNYTVNSASAAFDHLSFDFLSIMLYPSFNSCCIDPSKPTMTRKDGTTWTTQQAGLSAGDISTLEAMYPRTLTTWTSVVSRNPYQLDVFRIDGNGIISSAAWNDIEFRWKGWWNILNGLSSPGGQVTSVSRYDNLLDIFTAGWDNRVYAAAWNVDEGWKGWWPINDTNGNSFSSLPGSHISAVARDINNLDIFAISRFDGGVYTAYWNPDSGWQGWWRIRDGVAASAGEVVAVSRKLNQLDVFTIGVEGDVWTAYWHPASGGWQGWIPLGNPGRPVTRISAISSAEHRLHVFATRVDGFVFSKEWDETQGGWTAWKSIANGVATPGNRIVPVSRDLGKVDIFVVGTNGGVYTAAWQSGFDARNTYRGWWPIGGLVSPGSHLSAVAKDPNHLDVFAVGTDGNVWNAFWSGTIWSGWVPLPDVNQIYQLPSQ
jgi:hypothetical protein